MVSNLTPSYRHVFVLTDGATLFLAPHEAIRVSDRRSERSDPVVVWEVMLPSGIVRRLWPEDIVSWTQEEAT
jgi:hypothetical protein